MRRPRGPGAEGVVNRGAVTRSSAVDVRRAGLRGCGMCAIAAMSGWAEGEDGKCYRQRSRMKACVLARAVNLNEDRDIVACTADVCVWVSGMA